MFFFSKTILRHIFSLIFLFFVLPCVIYHFKTEYEHNLAKLTLKNLKKKGRIILQKIVFLSKLFTTKKGINRWRISRFTN